MGGIAMGEKDIIFEDKLWKAADKLRKKWKFMNISMLFLG